jgi:hypothetical protein
MGSRRPRKAKARAKADRGRGARRGALSRAAAERIANHGYQKLIEEGFSKEIAEQYRRETIADLMKPVSN